MFNSFSFKIIFLSLNLVLTTPLFAETILHDINGQNITFSSLKGKRIMINYWAEWCHACLEEITELNQFYAQHSDKIALFAVNFDAGSIDQQQALIKKYGIHYPSLQDPTNTLHLGDITGVPVTFIFNAEGKLEKTLYGGQTQRQLTQLLHLNN